MDENKPLEPCEDSNSGTAYDELVRKAKKIDDLERGCEEERNSAGQNSKAQNWNSLVSLEGSHVELLDECNALFPIYRLLSEAELQQLPTQLNVVATMWKNCIYPLFMLLNSQEPKPLEAMRRFLLHADNLMLQLQKDEKAGKLRDTWSECLGDLARLRTQIETGESLEFWKGIARQCYWDLSTADPSQGRLLFHLSTVANNDLLQQLAYNAKAMCVSKPYLAAKKRIMALLEPNSVGIYDEFIRIHQAWISQENDESLHQPVEQFLTLLPMRLDEAGNDWLYDGFYIGIALTCAMLGYEPLDNFLTRNIKRGDSDQTETSALKFTFSICKFVLERRVDVGIQDRNDVTVEDRGHKVDGSIESLVDLNVLSFLHVIFTFVLNVSQNENVMCVINRTFPWAQAAIYLNELMDCRATTVMEDVPQEEAFMQGLLDTTKYDTEIDFEDRAVPLRCKRLCELGGSLAKSSPRLIWDSDEHKFISGS